MKNEFDDITGKLGEPLWYLDGVPRYCEFHPDRCGVYIDYVAFLRIQCQECYKEFKVAVECPVLDGRLRKYLPDDWEPTLPNPKDGRIGSFHAGDPPRHCHCHAGETMNSMDMEVLEFWDRRNNRMDWQRRPECEGVLEFNVV